MALTRVLLLMVVALVGRGDAFRALRTTSLSALRKPLVSRATLKPYLEDLVAGKSLTSSQTEAAWDLILG
eukprot:scaffold47_cov258-Pinguiococcus_pyrenoidosus.AAC.72